MNQEQSLEALEKRREKLVEEYDALEDAIKATNKAIKNKKKDLDNRTQLKVTDHAIVRYLERVDGVNMDTIRSKIVTDRLRKLYLANDMCPGTYPTGENFRAYIKNNTVITVKT